RIPVEGVEHASFRILLPVHRKHVVNNARGWTAYQGYVLQPSLQIVEERDRNFQNAVQSLGLHLMGVSAPEIAEAIPLVVSAVEPDDEQSTGLQVFIQRFDGGFTIRGVVKHTDAVDDIEAFGSERQGENIGLECDEVAIGKILGGNFGGGAQVNADHTRPPAGSDLGEASHAASDVEDQLAFEIFGAESGFHQEMAFGFAGLVVIRIELGLLITMPLITETGSVVLGLHKTRNALHVGIRSLAGRTHEPMGWIACEFPAAVQAT